MSRDIAFTDHCRVALQKARADASRLGHMSVDPEHVFLALLSLEDGVASAALDRLGVDRLACAELAAAVLRHPSSAVPERTISFSRRTFSVLDDAMDRARRERTPGHTGHLLLCSLEVDGWSEMLGLDLTELKIAVAEAPLAYELIAR